MSWGEFLCRMGIHKWHYIDVLNNWGVSKDLWDGVCTRCGKIHDELYQKIRKETLDREYSIRKWKEHMREVRLREVAGRVGQD